MADHLTALDRLIEQQDQELVRDGVVSPLTQRQLQAYAEGEPIPHIDLHSPEMQLATARLFQALRHSRMPYASCDDDDVWFDDDEG